jgi:hypothetical protein
VSALIQGDRLAWGAVGLLWGLTALVVLLHRPGRLGGAVADRRTAWTWLLLAAATGTSLAGLPLSAAIAMPRVRWVTVDAPDLVATNGETWRKLRGPAVPVAGPDVAVPTVDAAGRWVLYGLLSGKAAPGLPAAEPAPLQPGATRLCRVEGDACRPWPVAWPDPARPLVSGELSWARAGDQDALAYDVETGLYLRQIEPRAPAEASHDGPASGPRPRPPSEPCLELVGRVAPDEPHEGSSVLFVVREVIGGRLKAMRIAATPSPSGSGHVFHVQRAEASLTAGPRVHAFVRPVLALTSLSLPLGVIALLLAPWLYRRRGETRREAAAWIGPHLEAAAVLAAGVAAAAPAVVAIASLWGSR